MADFKDQAKNKGEELKGKAKEAAGNATDNDELKNEGKKDQTVSDAKEKAQEFGDKVKDKANEVVGNIGDKIKGDDKYLPAPRPRPGSLSRRGGDFVPGRGRR